MLSNSKNRLRRRLFRIFRDNETRIHELSYLFWECTWRCNLACRHCGSDCKAGSSLPDMPLGDFLNSVKRLPENTQKNRIMVVITGGEPLLRDDLAECGRRLAGMGFRWGIVTNGMLYDEQMHKRLTAAGLSAVTVSLDGLEETHNWLRNNTDSFSKALQALKIISRTPGLTYDAVTCVHQRNISELESLKGLLLSEGILNWRIFTIAPIGRAADNAELQLSSPQLEQLFNFISRTRKEKRLNLTFSCEAYTGKYEEAVRDSYFFCRAGINIASVLIDGSISACPNINRAYSQGNVYNDDLSYVWENRFKCFREREWMRNGRCSNCKDFRQCLGGAMHLRTPECGETLRCYNFRG